MFERLKRLPGNVYDVTDFLDGVWFKRNLVILSRL